jgi:hypothetical protein
MKVKKIYKSENNSQLIFLLNNDRKIIRRNSDNVKKLSIEKWEDIHFIPSHFNRLNREITDEEERQLKKILKKNDKGSKSNATLNKLKRYVINIFNGK